MTMSMPINHISA